VACPENRTEAANVLEKMFATLMGHKHVRTKHGSGPTLQPKGDALKAFELGGAERCATYPIAIGALTIQSLAGPF